MSKFVILGVFWDGYQDIWNDFIALLNRNWPNCPFEVYIVDNSISLKDEQYKNIHFINAGKDAEFSKKVQIALEVIECDYLLLLLEDFFFSRPIDNLEIYKILSFIEENNINYYSMPMYEFIHKKEKEAYVKSNTAAFRVSKTADYTLTCQPGIWKKSFLKLCIGKENYNAWVFEGIYKLNSFFKNDKYLSKCLIDYRNPMFLLHGAIRGKMVRRTKRILKKGGYILSSSRETITIKRTIINFLIRFVEKALYCLHLEWIKKKNKKSVIKKYSLDIGRVASLVLVEKEFEEFFSGDVNS